MILSDSGCYRKFGTGQKLLMVSFKKKLLQHKIIDMDSQEVEMDTHSLRWPITTNLKVTISHRYVIALPALKLNILKYMTINITETFISSNQNKCMIMIIINFLCALIQSVDL